MNKDTHVYCTHCKNLKLDMETKGFPYSCGFENECEFWDIEDSRAFSERPHYEPLPGED